MRRRLAVRRVIAVLVLGLFTVGWLALGVRAFGGWAGFSSNPARQALVVATLGLTVLAGVSPFSMSSGRRADFSEIRLVPVALAVMLLFAWVPPWCDRRELWVIDGDTVRWLGLGLFVGGGLLRVWPIFVLRGRFSGFVAIQEGHQLATGGPYRWIRHPSYLGMLVNVIGWALVFRSAAGLLLVIPLGWLLAARMDAEETLLASEFGAEYEAYRRGTWRLLPGVY